MKILIDARLYGLENTGIGRYVVNLVSELLRIDKENEYIILLKKKYFESLRLPSNWKKIESNIPHYSLAEQTILPFVISSYNPDLVHFPHFNVPIFYKGKYVVTIHDLLMHKQKGLEATTLPPFVYFFKRLGYRIVFDLSIKNSGTIIVPSNAVKKEIKDFYGVSEDKVKVTYEGFDPKITAGKEPEIKERYFFYVGNAYPHKNLGRLIKAVLILNTKFNQKAILAISSARNIFTQRLSSLALKLKAEKYIRLLGFTPNEKLGGLFKNSIAFVFPSLSEGFGLPGLEAIASGSLVLSSDIPVLKEVYEDNAIYFDPEDEYSMAESMRYALNLNSLKKQEMIKKAQRFVKRYSWAKMAKETLQIYEEAGKSGHSLRQSQ